MSEPIGPGDMVECIRIGNRGTTWGFCVGGIYTVRQVRPLHTCRCGETVEHAGLRFKEIGESGPGKSWCSLYFRPISRRSDFERLLETLKTPTPERVDA